MSGSGPTVYGLFSDESRAKRQRKCCAAVSLNRYKQYDRNLQIRNLQLNGYSIKAICAFRA